ncbi:DHA2 family efflux MFS transporter permease subunit [Reyranella sp. MMS21-HV4-11]|uniref:DHA2 family efflux MFS transporter permease subunit n=1 Tax=Reyranella humidisoli TaxID=2849149 RepID=A0ABS6IQ16_9HYPH|nr:DHA2 family efflux MFS transporter permease subunit [Reyranella sp. MMS21-HV4-11]MBU8875298.1 DHA2 family efflux MFS transporter permease subunit [Reyranella sp. MMS21-HV4-11]
MTTPENAPPDESIKRLLPWLVAVAFFMQSLDTTILNTAVPAIAQAMDVTPLSVKSVLASYTLSLAVFIPVSGWMADRFGTRRVFAAAIGLFCVGSLLCGLSTSIEMLVACRVVQGAGGAMMMPVGRMTLARTFGKADLVRAMSFVAIPALIGPMVGPVAGGAIVHWLHWSVVFFVNIPVGIVGLYFIRRYLPDYREDKTHPLDVLGLILFGGGIALLSYVLEVFGDNSLSRGEILGLLAVAALLLAGYGIRASLTAFPLLDLALFRIRTFRSAVNGGFFTRLGLGGIPFLFPLLYQVGLGFSPIQSGLLVLPQAIASIGLKTFMPAILARLGYRNVLVFNTIVVGLLIMSFAKVGAETPIWRIVLQAFVLGFFTSMQYTSMNTLVYADVSGPQTSGASTIAATGQQLAISFGVAGASLIAALFVPTGLHTHAATMIYGVQQAFLILGVMTVLSSVVFMELKRDDGNDISRHDSAPSHETHD